jgi:hypothetical protein
MLSRLFRPESRQGFDGGYEVTEGIGFGEEPIAMEALNDPSRSCLFGRDRDGALKRNEPDGSKPVAYINFVSLRAER